MDKIELSRRTAIGAIMAAPVAANAQPRRGSDKRPNILFLMPDQHRYDWLSGNPNLPVRTPNLDALAARGVRFAKAYSQSPQCAPSRACLAAGREYDHTGTPGNFANYPAGAPTYYSALRDAGYHVAACGKLDLSKPAGDEGLDGRNHMAEWGFSDLNNCGGKGDAVTAYQRKKGPDEPYMFYLAKKGTAESYVKDFQSRRGARAEEYSHTEVSPQSDEDYQDNWIGRVGLDMMNRFPKGRPWHLVVNFAGPHDPENITERMERTVRDRKFPQPVRNTQLAPDVHNAIRQNYTAMVENLDRWVGLYVDELKKRGEFDNTVIIFSSDHGEMLGDHDRWAKVQPYEPSLCVPLIVGGGGVKPRRSDALVELIDVAATCLDYGGAKRPEGMTAQSFRPLLEGKTDKHRDHVNSGIFNWRLVSDGRYKLIRGYDPSKEQPLSGAAPGPDAPLTLFDLQTDPQELQNVAASQPEVVARLVKLLPPPNPDPKYGMNINGSRYGGG